MTSRAKARILNLAGQGILVTSIFNRILTLNCGENSPIVPLSLAIFRS